MRDVVATRLAISPYAAARVIVTVFLLCFSSLHQDFEVSIGNAATATRPQWFHAAPRSIIDLNAIVIESVLHANFICAAKLSPTLSTTAIPVAWYDVCFIQRLHAFLFGHARASKILF